MYKTQISVIMPVFNGQKYLRDAINSILNQTYKDFEFIIINDGSTDNSKKIIEEFSDDRIIVIEQSNKGLAQALNIAAAKCSGKYIARMDCDDISDPDRFLIQYNFLEAHPHISVLSCAVNYIDEKSKILGRSFTVTCPIAIKRKLLLSGCVISHPGVMMRKIDFYSVNGYSELMGGRFTDYHLWVKFVNKGFKIQNLSRVLLQYRIIESSISSQFVITNSAKKLLLKLIKEENPNPSEVMELNNLCNINNQSFDKRKDCYNNIPNRTYSILAFFGERTLNQLYSGVNNFISFFS